MTREDAIRMAESGWWKEMPLEEAARFQLFEARLCMPFGEFHEGVEKMLGRSVWTHEFAFVRDPGGLQDEALGRAPKRTFEDIMALIPADKRIVLVVPPSAAGEGR